MKRSVSIIICTQGRVESLTNTMRALSELTVPSDWEADLIVVDNGSSPRTREVVLGAPLKNLAVQYLQEKKAGKSNALNTALKIARGEVLLFTDDDVVPAKDWLEKLATPLLQKKYDGVVGRIDLGKELERPWWAEDHRKGLAAFDASVTQVDELIGANMGIHRSVFERIPVFDPELGPGTSGFGEETLLSWQMRETGFRLGVVPDAVVVHHPEVTRLKRSDWLKTALKRGRSLAYITHHWQHDEVKHPLVRYYTMSIKLGLRRLLQPPPAMDAEGCPEWEMSYVAELETCRHFLIERKRSRNYARHGLQKFTTDSSVGAAANFNPAASSATIVS